MSERSERVEEVTGLYLQILQQLNNHNVPQWLELDLTFQQMKVLYILKQRGPSKMSDLSRELGVSMPTITGIISRLVERRDSAPLVNRVTSPKDRREVQAHLSESGLRVTQQLDNLNHKLMGQALAQLTDGELEDARVGLNHINVALSEQKPIIVPDTLEGVAANLTLVIGDEKEEVQTLANAAPSLN